MSFNEMKNVIKNSYANALLILGWVYIILGIIGSFILGRTFAPYYGEFNTGIFFGGIFVTILFGALFLGAAEIIRLLNDNRRLLATIAQNNDPASIEEQSMDELPEL